MRIFFPSFWSGIGGYADFVLETERGEQKQQQQNRKSLDSHEEEGVLILNSRTKQDSDLNYQHSRAARATSSGAHNFRELALQRLRVNINGNFLFTGTMFYMLIQFVVLCRSVRKKEPETACGS